MFGVVDVVGVGGKTLGVLFTELLRFCVPWVAGVLLLCTNGIVNVSSSSLEVRGVFLAILRFPKSGSFVWILICLSCGVHWVLSI